jgi:hypothetical protein
VRATDTNITNRTGTIARPARWARGRVREAATQRGPRTLSVEGAARAYPRFAGNGHDLVEGECRAQRT